MMSPAPGCSTLHLDRGYDYPKTGAQLASYGLADLDIQHRAKSGATPKQPLQLGLRWVAWCTSSFAATTTLSAPFAHSNTIRDRCANECGDFGRRDHLVNVWRSSSVNVNACFGRPLRPMPRSMNYLQQ